MSSDAEIRVEGLTKYFEEGDSFLTRLRPGASVKHVRAVDGVDLTVEPGETVGLVGESGCGKSTLARSILRLIEPTDGRVYVRGEEVTAFSDAELRSLRGDVQMIFQDPFSSLNPRYTVSRTLAEPMAVHGVGDDAEDRRRRAGELIERVGLGREHLDRYPHEFSGGQRQRIAIARALAVEPRVIVADEPVSALDVSVQAQILNLLTDLKEEFDLTMLLISHDLSVVRQICDRVVVMYLGEVVEEAATADLFSDPKHPYAQVLVSSIPIPDPTADREKTSLSGDVPTPIDPPDGCRFHPRCPAVIPPEDWSYGQEEWRRVLQVKNRIADGTVQPSAMREQLESSLDGPVSDERVVDELYEEHVVEGGITASDRLGLTDSLEDVVRTALTALVDERRADALSALDRFDTVCGRDHPRRMDVDGHAVACHRYDDSKQGGPDVDV